MLHGFILFTIFLCVQPTFQLRSECRLSIHPSDNRERTYKEVFRWVLPVSNYGSTALSVKHNQNVELTCGNGFIKNDLISNAYTFKCDNGKYNKTFYYDDLLCRSDDYKNIMVVEKTPSLYRSKLLKCSEPEFRLYEVKILKPDGSVKMLYNSCVDKKEMRAKFSHQPRRQEKPLLRHRPNDAVWGFDGFGQDANERFYLSRGYVKALQAKRIAKAYPLKYGPTKDYPYYFNRGHLAAMADFNDEKEQRATCEYINAAPQWDTFNSGSWSLVEREAREMLQTDTNDWEIYTGTYGVILTPGGALKVAPIFDLERRFMKQLLPVPMLYWKIVHNLKDSTMSRAFVGVNNPEYKNPDEIPQKYKICNPIPASGNGTYYRGNEFQGFYYECKMDDLLNRLKTAEKIVK